MALYLLECSIRESYQCTLPWQYSRMKDPDEGGAVKAAQDRECRRAGSAIHLLGTWYVKVMPSSLPLATYGSQKMGLARHESRRARPGLLLTLALKRSSHSFHLGNSGSGSDGEGMGEPTSRVIELARPLIVYSTW